MISQYWVGQIPKNPLSILVKDSDGVTMNLSDYSDIKIKLLGTDNEEIDTSGGTLNLLNLSLGRIIYSWPTNKTLFEYSGDYVLQIELSGTGKKDFTTTHTIRVRELGRNYR